MKYDKKGNNIETNSYNSDGSLGFKYIYKYDEKGNKIEVNIYDSDGNLNFRWIYKYDEKGNMIEDNKYWFDANLADVITYKYEFDKKDNWIKKIEYRDNHPETITEREIEYYK